MIYVISNVDYPEGKRIRPQPDDLLVFLNKARTARYYSDHPSRKKMCIRRSPEPSYGSDIPGIETRFVFSGPPDKTVPGEIIARLKKFYDWNYEIEPGKTKCATTGYMAVKYLESLYPGEEIVLVNFGFDVKNSTYRCPWHNWQYEARELAKFKHIYTAERRDAFIDARKRVFYNLSGYLGDNVYASAVVASIVAAGFAVNVSRNGHHALWDNCPILTREITESNADVVIRQHNQFPWTNDCRQIVAGATATAAYDLGTEIPLLVEFPHVWMKIDAAPIIRDPYVVINAGWQNSAPTKKWSKEHWQRVIELCPELKFVQMGQKKNHAELIPGAVDMIDKTSVENLARLVRDARCVVSPPSGVIHLAAAFRRPVVMLSGGREPAKLAAYRYPGFKVISRCGGDLECCKNGGCHRNHFGTEEKQCNFYHSGSESQPTAHCMWSITPDEVSVAIKDLIQSL